MHETTTTARHPPPATTEPAWVRWSLTAVALAFLSLFLLVPVIAVFR